MKSSSKAIVRALIAIALMGAMLAIAPASAGATGSPSSGAPTSGAGGYGGQGGHVWVGGHGHWHGHHKPYPLPPKGSDHCGRQRWNCHGGDAPSKPTSAVPSWCTDTSPFLHLSDSSKVECDKLLGGGHTDHFTKKHSGKGGRHHMNRRLNVI